MKNLQFSIFDLRLEEKHRSSHEAASLAFQSQIANRKSQISYNLSRLRPAIRPFRLHWFPRLRGTNDHAAAMRKRGELFAPAIVLTGRQTAGRGRGEHTWWSGRGCLTATFILAVEEHLAPHQLPLIAGLAVRNAAAELTGSQAIQLKWPNDILHNGRKLAGLLCERINKVDLIGLGLNVNLDRRGIPPGLRNSVTSLGQITGAAFDLTAVLITIATHLHQALSRRREISFSEFLGQYNQHHALVGRRIRVLENERTPITGRCEGLDEMGRLKVRDRSRLHHVIAGQILFIDPN